MEDGSKASIPSLEGKKIGLLPTISGAPGNPTTRRRSTSITPSVRSSRSDITIVDNHSNVPVLDRKAVRRRRTQIAEVKISRLSCFLGFLLGPRITERAAAATIKCPSIEEDEDIFDSSGCPWIQSVRVLPSKNAGIEEHQQARCMFDTGCLQGNLVSKEFAQKLGYTESDFKPLTSREKNGGTSATGHTHMPEGVLHLTWYHNTSPRLYNGMRFLVSPSQQYELVIGARSILAHKLISYPNFGIDDDAGVTQFKLGSDKNLDKLTQDVAKLTNDLKTLNHERAAEVKAKKENKVKQLDVEIERKEKKLEIKQLELELYDAKKQHEVNPQNGTNKMLMERIESDLKEAKARHKDTPAARDLPHVNISRPDGNSRAATGFSIRPGGRPRRI
ncbi:MAG: hypothetical protein M1813_005496 [Trichoglossum hirsutum]|nr:MAG: hypothetical protein M1813_005496 [Trichoglossum hirsutum]